MGLVCIKNSLLMAQGDVNFKYAQAFVDNGVKFDKDKETNVDNESPINEDNDDRPSVSSLDCQSMKFSIPTNKASNLNDLKFSLITGVNNLKDQYNEIPGYMFL